MSLEKEETEREREKKGRKKKKTQTNKQKNKDESNEAFIKAMAREFIFRINRKYLYKIVSSSSTLRLPLL